LDDKPFIVVPYLANGNARDYLVAHPKGNRLHIVRIQHPYLPFDLFQTLLDQLHDIATGLDYLHSQQIVHGDLKAVR